MRLMVDMSSAQPQGSMKINGGGEYACRILREIVERAVSDNINIYVVLNSSLGENTEISKLVSGYHLKVCFYAEVADFSDLVRKNHIDTLFIPVCYSKYSDLQVDNNVRLITVVHDLCPVYNYELKVKYGRYGNIQTFLRLKSREIFKGKKEQAFYVKSHEKLFSLNGNQVMITDSYFSKASFRRYLNVRKDLIDKTLVLYVPEKISNPEMNAASQEKYLKSIGVGKNMFFLLSSACRWAKNISIVLFSLDEMFSNRKYDALLKNYKVLVLGVDRIYLKYFKSHIKNLNYFVFMDYVTDQEMNCLYENMATYIYPSMLEGFGLPPLEAMKYGKVPLCSTAMSIPEVSGEGAIYFDPSDKRSIELAILQYLDTDTVTAKKKLVRKHIEEISRRREQDLQKLLDVIFLRKN